jgi:hypothetical protein
MKSQVSIEQLLRWRLTRAESEAPRAPRGAQLLELARPWWETWPERFQALVERVGRIQIAYGHAMAEANHPRVGYPVPAVLVRAGEELETSARVLYLQVSEGRLRLRFQLNAATGPAPESFEVTFVDENGSRPLFSAPGTLSVDSEYRVDAEVSEGLARCWALLKVTDRMPFRFILRAGTSGS